MATRGTALSPIRIEALNMIDIEFYGNNEKDKNVQKAWKILLDHLASAPKNQNDPNYSASMETWSTTLNNLHCDLLDVMAKALGYDFDKVYLKKGSYTPEGHATIEMEQTFLRKSLVDVFSGKKSIPIFVKGDDNENKSS